MAGGAVEAVEGKKKVPGGPMVGKTQVEYKQLSRPKRYVPASELDKGRRLSAMWSNKGEGGDEKTKDVDVAEDAFSQRLEHRGA